MSQARRAAAAAFVALTVGSIVSAASAVAASGDPGYVFENTPVYTGPNFVYSIAYYTTTSAWIPMQCYTDTSDTPGSSHRWFKFYNQSRWVLSGNVDPQPALPHC